MEKQQKIRVENFKLGRNTSSQINSAIIILIFGLITVFLPVFQFLNLYNGAIEDQGINMYEGYFSLLSFLGFVVLSTLQQYIVLGILGWGMGGMVAAILYGNEGKNGPLYASFLIFRTFLGLSPIAIFALVVGLNGEGILFFAYILLVLVISLPLIFISGLSYRFGLWLSPQT